MKHTLTHEERSRLDRLVVEAEKRAGAQIVLAVVERSDHYPELPWKAFALGASLGGGAVLAVNLMSPLPSPSLTALLAIVMMLSTGAGLALLCVFVPDFARLFLQTHRADVEARQYADSLFLSREMFAARDRRAVLLMISLFERRIVVLPDTGLSQTLNRTATSAVIREMRVSLRAGQTARALEAGLKKLEEIITQTECAGALPNVIEEKGA